MGANGSMYEEDDETITVMKGVRLTENVINRMRGASMAASTQSPPAVPVSSLPAQITVPLPPLSAPEEHSHPSPVEPAQPSPAPLSVEPASPSPPPSVESAPPPLSVEPAPPLPLSVEPAPPSPPPLSVEPAPPSPLSVEPAPPLPLSVEPAPPSPAPPPLSLEPAPHLPPLSVEPAPSLLFVEIAHSPPPPSVEPVASSPPPPLSVEPLLLPPVSVESAPLPPPSVEPAPYPPPSVESAPSSLSLSVEPPLLHPASVEPVSPAPCPVVGEEGLCRTIAQEPELQKGLEQHVSLTELEAHQREELEKEQTQVDERIAEENLKQAVLKDRAAAQDHRLRAQLYAHQLEQRVRELRRQDEIYREQVAKLEWKGQRFYSAITESYQQASREVSAKFRHYQMKPACADLQREILKCYRENSGQTLSCSKVASLYLQCVRDARQNKTRPGD